MPRVVGGAVLAAAFLVLPGVTARGAANQESDIVVKAALFYNFAKFTEWPALPAGAPLAACVVGNDGFAAALADDARGRHIKGHAIDVRRPQNAASWADCHLLFVADLQVLRATAGLAAIKTRPVLTVSDGKNFATTAGMIELYVEDKKLRFAINLMAAERSGLRLDSRLLSLARIIRAGG